MKNFIEIDDYPGSEILSTTLSDILIKIFDKKKYERWYLFDLYCTAKVNSNINVLELEDKAKNSPSGLSLSWEELSSIAENLDQVIEIVLVAYQGTVPAEYENTLNWWKSFPLVIQIVDGSFWEVYSKDTSVIEYLCQSYPCVRTLTLEEKFKSQR